MSSLISSLIGYVCVYACLLGGQEGNGAGDPQPYFCKCLRARCIFEVLRE